MTSKIHIARQIFAPTGASLLGGIAGALIAISMTATMPASGRAATAQGSGGQKWGRVIAFVRYSPQSGHPHIYTVDFTGQTPKRLDLPVIAAEGPAWAPDGKTLAFIAGRNAPNESDVTRGDQLAVANADGSGVRHLTRGDTHNAGPAWSPDGRRLALVRSSRASPNRSWIAVINADGSHLRRLTHGAIDLEPSWSPDGRTIAFLRIDPSIYQSGIWLVRPDGSGLHRILDHLRNVTEPVWSPSGARLLVQDGKTLYSVRPAGEGLRILATLSADSKGAREDPLPAWSPDGRLVVFSQVRPGTFGRSDLWVVGANGNGLRRLTRSPGLDTDPTWGP
jgi:TolB protein